MLDAIPIIHICAKILGNIPKIFISYSYHGLDANPMDVLDVIPGSLLTANAYTGGLVKDEKWPILILHEIVIFNKWTGFWKISQSIIVIVYMLGFPKKTKIEFELF